MGVAYTLSRTFFWSENILWKNDLLSHHATVFLVGKDSIIDAPLVYEYLQATGEGEGMRPSMSAFTGMTFRQTTSPKTPFQKKAMAVMTG
jgi:hypothetical protein